jgi:hypothetical protein
LLFCFYIVSPHVKEEEEKHAEEQEAVQEEE